MESNMAVFQGKKIRKTLYNNEWWFSVVDVVGVLTDSPDAGAYWRKLKQRLKEEGSEVVTFCHGLKLPAPDGKLRETDCANVEVKSGALFYGQTRRREDVVFDEELRQETEDAAKKVHMLIESGVTPKAEYSNKCKKCSLYELCMPKVSNKASNYLMKAIEEE